MCLNNAHMPCLDVIETHTTFYSLFTWNISVPLFHNSSFVSLSLSLSLSPFVFGNKQCKHLNLSSSMENSRKLRVKCFTAPFSPFMITGPCVFNSPPLSVKMSLSNTQGQTKKNNVGRGTKLYYGKASHCVLSGFQDCCWQIVDFGWVAIKLCGAEKHC